MKAENQKIQGPNTTKRVWVEPTVEIINELIEGTHNHIYDENVSTSIRGNAS